MLASTHRLTGAAAWLAVAPHLPLPGWQAAAGTALAVATAGGRLSPDCDSYRWWRVFDRLTPDELLGRGGPLQHRGLTHWWGLPAAVVCAVYALVPAGYAWVAWAFIAGWISHLLGDLVWGKASPYDHRGPGIPLAPWWCHVGVGLDVGGGLETVTRRVVLPLVLAWLTVTALGVPGVAEVAAGLCDGEACW